MKPPSLAKAILAILLCQVLTVTQVFAIAGGPPVSSGFGGGGGTTLNLTGTYSGVLQGLTETSPNDSNGGSNTPPPIPGDPNPTPTPVTPPTTGVSTAIGLFDLGITQTTGLATGAFLVFADGRVFTGTIAGAVDPGSGALQGILQARFDFVLQTLDAAGALVSVPIAALASGRLDTVISGATTTSTGNTSGSAGSVGGNTATTTASATLVTISGTANLAITFGQVDSATLQPIVDRVLTFSVNGFRNSTTVAPTATFTTTAGG